MKKFFVISAILSSLISLSFARSESDNTISKVLNRRNYFGKSTTHNEMLKKNHLLPTMGNYDHDDYGVGYFGFHFEYNSTLGCRYSIINPSAGYGIVDCGLPILLANLMNWKDPVRHSGGQTRFLSARCAMSFTDNERIGFGPDLDYDWGAIMVPDSLDSNQFDTKAYMSIGVGLAIFSRSKSGRFSTVYAADYHIFRRVTFDVYWDYAIHPLLHIYMGCGYGYYTKGFILDADKNLWTKPFGGLLFSVGLGI